MKTLRFFLCVSIIIAAIICSCDRNDVPEPVQLGEVGVYCVLEPDMSFNQKVVLKRLPLPGEPEIYTSVSGAKVEIASQGEVYEFSETMVPGVYKADFKPVLGQQYTLGIVTPEGDVITSTMSIPGEIKIGSSNAADLMNTSWYGPLNNAVYPGFAVSAENVDEDYYIVVKGHPIYYGRPSGDTLKYWSTNHAGVDPINKVDLKFIESDLAAYQDNAFSYPEDDASIKLTFHKDYLLIRNPHQFNPNRLLGTNYMYNQEGEESWDNGFIVTAGPFAAFSESTRVPLRDMSPEAIAAFGQDYCQTYSMKLSFVQLAGGYVEYFKNMPGFPDVQYNQSYVFGNKEHSNINGGVGIFTSKVKTYKLEQNFVYTDDIHNKGFREYYLSSKQFEYNTLKVSNQKASECLDEEKTKSVASPVANTITLEAQGNKLLVYRKGQYNCGAKIEFAVTNEGNTITLQEVNKRGIAYCYCPMESSCEIEGMKEGVYIINLQHYYTKEFYDPIRFTFEEGAKKTVDLGYDLGY